mgnify:FL=1|jgi:hypothetical protein
MNQEARLARIKGLQSIQKKALNIASTGADAFEVRDFVTEAKKGLAYAIPEEDQFRKSKALALEYKRQQATDPIVD